MLRVSRVAHSILPCSTSPELPRLLSKRRNPIVTVSSNLHKFVMEHDHRSRTSGFFRGPFPGELPFSHSSNGSLVGDVLTVGGVVLFVLTFGYNIGKPVIDAHRELFLKSTPAAYRERNDEGADGSWTEATESGDISPVEEFDDVIDMKQDER
ncbi:hypothetical protein JKF63_05548 [Porcisia hertigi]|uniref:Uncharacterized protein n=1 Tax=Porcisia hertigi TaxID=2761500 RepID=A0A836ITT4_9TRYP|nr:hypothetical protein JKF63_05548 [Porcisia hertigi]